MIGPDGFTRLEGYVAEYVNESPAALRARVTEAERKLEAVEALAGEWAEEGPSLVRNAYSGGDVHEGHTLEHCARALRAALGGES